MKLLIRRQTQNAFELYLSTTSDEGKDVEIAHYFGAFGDRKQREWARACGISAATLNGYVASVAARYVVGKAKPYETFDVPGPAPLTAPTPPELPAIRIRPLIASTSVEPITVSAATWTDAIRAALDLTDIPFADPRIEWDNKDALAVVDLDRDYPLSPSELAARIGELRPAPFLWHPSHGGGAKLYYHAQNGFSARHYACVAAFALAMRDRHIKPEVKSDTRHPFFPRSGERVAPALSRDTLGGGSQAPNLKIFGAMLMRAGDEIDLDDSARDAAIDKLRASGWVDDGSGRPPHAFCPIAPGVGNADKPLQFGERGIYCHYCASKGYRMVGAGKPGFVPYTTYVGGQRDTRLRTMVKCLTHWTHAKHVLNYIIQDDAPGDRTTRISQDILRTTYEALLMQYHAPDDIRIPRVFKAMDGIVRLGGVWASDNGRTNFVKDIGPTLRALPAAQYIETEDGISRAKVDVEIVNKFQQADWELDSLGYTALFPVHGASVWGRHNKFRDSRVRFYVTPSYLPSQYAPRYIEPSARTPDVMAEAKAIFEETFPQLPWNYLYLLILLKGYAEAGAVQCPYVIAHGPSGSGKSSVPHIAAAICGDVNAEIIFISDRGRFTQAFRAAAGTGTFVAINEVFKEAELQKLPPRAALDNLLGMTEFAQSHVLYHGTVALDRNPVVILTDVTLPQSVANDAQLGRRIVNVPLVSSVSWAAPMAKAGLSRMRDFRMLSMRHAWACDVVLSHVMDMLAPGADGRPPMLSELLPQLGFAMLETEAADEVDDRIRAFYDAVVAAPPLVGTDAKRFGRDWCLIRPGDVSILAELWSDLADADRDRERVYSRILAERDLSRVLALPPGVRFASKKVNGTLAVRFFRGSASRPTWANGKEVSEK